MGKLNSNGVGQPVKAESISPFYVVRDYRKTLKLKKQRDLRKMKIIQEKMMLREVEKNSKMTMIQEMNRSMLDDDFTWNKVQEDMKMGCSEEQYTNDY